MAKPSSKELPLLVVTVCGDVCLTCGLAWRFYTPECTQCKKPTERLLAAEVKGKPAYFSQSNAKAKYELKLKEESNETPDAEV